MTFKDEVLAACPDPRPQPLLAAPARKNWGYSRLTLFDLLAISMPPGAWDPARKEVATAEKMPADPWTSRS